MKTCIGCKIERDISEFHVQSAKKDGLCSYCKLCNNYRASVWAKENPDKVKRNSRINHLKRYGLDEESYTELWDSQDGKCKICLKETDLVIDHNHKTGEIRGLLCTPCNIALGLLNESLEIATSVVEYLRD